MHIANWISAAGNAIEIAGFAFLAIELMKTNTSAIVENGEMRSLDVAADCLIGYESDDGKAGGLRFEGGVLGKLIDNINARQLELTKSKVLINKGLKWTGIGIVVQFVGSLGQALGW
jgi:hypothetical protein